MAIPGWTWNRRAGSPDRERRLDAADLDEVSGTLGTLSNPVRLEVLAVLDGHPEGVPYEELRGMLSIADKGKLNYHLRQLDGLVRREGDGYVLSERGEALVGAVDDGAFRPPE